MSRTPRVIRTRRYVSAAAGCYPAPVPRGTQRPPSDQTLLFGAAPLPQPARFEIAEPTGPALSLPVLDAIAAEAAPQDPIGLGSTRRRPVRTLIGAALGFGLGLCAAWLLLILADPAVRWPLWNDPVALWESVDDVWVRMSVLLIAAGFVLLGALFSRPRRSP